MLGARNVMNRKQQLRQLANRFVDRRYGTISTRLVTGIMRGYTRRAIIQHGRQWLRKHDALPSGVHRCNLLDDTGRVIWGVIVDFDRLLADPDYPEAEWLQQQRNYE